ncbi:uncharacterized protein ACRADG_006370 [Cochliomyia hominivorax]
MSDLNCANLIDLSLEDDTPSCNDTNSKTENCNTLLPSETTNDGILFIPPTWRKRDSLDNNPFDCVQKLAERVDDPFDMVEKEACLKARQAQKPQTEVKLGNLLSLSDDNLLDEEEMPESPALQADDINRIKSNALDMESPPVLLNEKLVPDSVSGPDTDSNPNSSAESTASAKLKKSMEYRKRLLKLSISNAAFSSPLARKTSMEFEDILGTPVSSMFSRAAEFGENLLAAESPLKLVEDEDLMAQEPPNFIDSEKNFEKDLEMLKIPILNELPSPAVEQISIKSPIKSNVKIENCSTENALPNLAAIKAKLKAKREEINNNHQQEISSLIHNLKSLITRGEVVDENKKQQADTLLEALSSALKPTDTEETLKPLDLLNVPQPQPIKRQGTFDIELQENENNNLDNQPLVQDMPNCMISSSATYDGETAEEKQHLNLPEIAPLSPQNSSPEYHQEHENHDSVNENHLQPDVNDIMEQLSKLLINNSGDNPPSNHNPTFIVVMNTNQLNHSNINSSQQNIVDAKQRSSFVANYLENSINDGSPDLTKVNSMTRRRSQSLSIHDKVKIVQLPLQPPTPRSLQKQQHVQFDDSPPVTTTPPASDIETPEFKTPARMERRNSYSSGTPYTAHVGVRRSGFGSDCKNPLNVRRPQTLDTHHEGQQQAIVRPMTMPSNNLPSFKPDLKKKPKHNTESIIKSSGPLKATIPVKKVAPMLKTSPPTPDNVGKSSSNLHNTSLQNPSKISRVPTTPLPTKGGSSSMGVGVGYPNACSTPAAFTSPLKRTTGPVNKPRYSYMSATPNPKSSSTSSASASLKRRTITEFKAKSPLKPRVSSVGLAAAAAAASTTTRTTTGSSRLSTSAGARISKTPMKTTTSNTATIKPTSRLGSRVSVGGSVLSTRNKENKRP